MQCQEVLGNRWCNEPYIYYIYMPPCVVLEALQHNSAPNPLKKIRYSLINLLCSMTCTIPNYSAFELYFFPLTSLFVLFLLQSLILSLQPEKHSGTHLQSNFSTQADVQSRHSFLMCHLKDPKVMLADM